MFEKQTLHKGPYEMPLLYIKHGYVSSSVAINWSKMPQRVLYGFLSMGKKCIVAPYRLPLMLKNERPPNASLNVLFNS